jgi:starch-binding outer membrane protein, SusD/RagB family
MNRNPRHALLAAALLMVGAVGCTDTTELPTSTITDATYFDDPSSYRAFLGKIYSGLAVSGQRGPAGDPDLDPSFDEGFSQYLRLYWEMQELPTDEAVIAWGDPGIPETNTQLWASNNPFVVGMYHRVAFQVGMANEFLRQTTEAKLSERNVSPELAADIRIFRAEARFLRALSYWHGIDIFGNIPLVTEEDPIGRTAPLQSTRQEIFDFLVSELTAIQADLPASAGRGTYGRATKEAAAMLLAKLYLNAEVYTGTPQYAQALAAAQQVIAGSFTLDPSYRHLFQADNHTSPEIIFPVIQDGKLTQGYGGTTFLIHASCGGSMNPADQGVNGCWFGLRVRQEAYELFLPDDPRGSFFWTDGQTVDVTTISNFNNGVAVQKFTNKTSAGTNGSDLEFPDTDFPMFRLGDAYLMYAEAHLRGGGGDRAQALAYVNALRQRAFGDVSGNIADGDLDLEFILDERTRELLWEAHRRTDLVRYGLFTGGDYLWQWKGGVATGKATETFRNLYPLPESELTTNPNLTQNPGY